MLSGLLRGEVMLIKSSVPLDMLLFLKVPPPAV